MHSARRFPLTLRFAPVVLAAGLVAFAACGDDDSSGPEEEPFTGTVRIVDNAFSPRDVSISVGDSVTWRWDGGNNHSVTQGTTPDASQDPTRLFDSPIKSSGTFGYRFTAEGTVPYFCRPHFSMGMRGTITVNP